MEVLHNERTPLLLLFFDVADVVVAAAVAVAFQVKVVVKAVDRLEIVHEQLVLLHPLVLSKLREIVWGDAHTTVVSRQVIPTVLLQRLCSNCYAPTVQTKARACSCSFICFHVVLAPLLLHN